MMHTVSGKHDGTLINFAPADVVEEVLQNVRTLLMTTLHSVPLDRALGIDASFLDRPAPQAMARLRVRIVEDIMRSEPRVNIKVVEFKEYEGETLRGAFYPVVQVEVRT